MMLEIVLIDIDRKRTEGEAMDLNHSLFFVRPAKIWAGDYPDCEGADLVVIAAGLALKPEESRLKLVDRNVEIFRHILSKITQPLNL
ncbi:MAG: hypothetical protein ACE5I5_06480 [Candidatus Heimdallarchaeota archaeon]